MFNCNNDFMFSTDMLFSPLSSVFHYYQLKIIFIVPVNIL